MKVGIIGLPQTGKTSLYNALTRSQVELNRFGGGRGQRRRDRRARSPLRSCGRGVPAQEDHACRHRVYRRRRAHRARRTAGAGSDKFGTDFFVNVRNMDALVLVVRAFDDRAIPAPPGGVNALTRGRDRFWKSCCWPT